MLRHSCILILRKFCSNYVPVRTLRLAEQPHSACAVFSVYVCNVRLLFPDFLSINEFRSWVVMVAGARLLTEELEALYEKSLAESRTGPSAMSAAEHGDVWQRMSTGNRVYSPDGGCFGGVPFNTIADMFAERLRACRAQELQHLQNHRACLVFLRLRKMYTLREGSLHTHEYSVLLSIVAYLTSVVHTNRGEDAATCTICYIMALCASPVAPASSARELCRYVASVLPLLQSPLRDIEPLVRALVEVAGPDITLSPIEPL